MLDAKLMAKFLLDCADWAEMRNVYGFMTVSESATNNAIKVCELFIADIAQYETELRELKEYYSHPDCYGKVEAALGYDLWLTSQGHGTGFWDRETLPEHLQKTLTDLSKKFEHKLDVYEVDGVIYMNVVGIF